MAFFLEERRKEGRKPLTGIECLKKFERRVKADIIRYKISVLIYRKFIVAEMRNNNLKMSEAMLNIIHAVLAYKVFICCQNSVIPKEQFNWYYETEKYYHSIPLPTGMRKNRDHYNTILRYENTEELQQLDLTDFTELENHDSWFWIIENE